MSKLEAAAARLKAALDRLETGLAARPALQTGRVSPAEELRSERDALAARVAGLEEERRALAKANEEIERRLDTMIGEVRDALGEEQEWRTLMSR